MRLAGSLRDQLVKAGLASNAQAKQAERAKRAEEQAQRQTDNRNTKKARSSGKPDAKRKPKSDPTSVANVKRKAAEQRAQKMAKDRALAEELNQKTAAKALRAEIKQLVKQNDKRVRATREDDVAYNFLHGKKIKRLYVPTAQRDELVAGSLVIVNNDGQYHFVPANVAEQIAQRDPKRIIVAHSNEKPDDKSADTDDFYAKFEVPDDLDW